MRVNRWALPPVLALVFGLVLSAMAMAVIDAEAPVGTNEIVWVNDVLPGRKQAPEAAVDEALARYAAERGVAVARERADPTRAAMARTLYVTEPARGRRVPHWR